MKTLIKTEAVEICPHCDSENSYPNYDTDKLGYVVICKTCGKKMMLCDECLHAPDNTDQFCDWHGRQSKEYEIGICFRGITINRLV